jgi:hypothetical protein
MPTENDFVAFATGAGANVMSVATYLATASTGTGYVTGIADPTSVNVALRQGTSMAAMIAAFIVQYSGQPALDNGGISTLLANFVKGLQALNRIRLLANLNLYVATTGNDSNAGTSAGAPFLTLQAAANAALNLYDTNGFSIIVNVADGAYTGGVTVTRALVGGGQLNFIGDLANPSNCIISVTSNSCFQVSAGTSNIAGFKLIATGNATAAQGCAIISSNSGFIVFYSINFGACTQGHVICDSGGNIVASNAAYTISGGSISHISCNQGFFNCAGITVTIANAVTFTAAFAFCAIGGAMQTLTMAFSGAAVTGSRYNASSNGVIYTNSGGANYFPGSSAGVTTSGGQYL